MMPEPAPIMLDYALGYLRLGWVLCHIPLGTKGPTTDGWNSPAAIIDTEDKARAAHARHPQNGWGLVHGPSGTCALDIDHFEYCKLALSELGIDLGAEIANAPQIIGREGRGKAIFRVPEGVTLRTHKLLWPRITPEGKPTMLLELRAGAVQDVLPPTIHPDTHRAYEWRAGGPDTVPELPKILLSLWENWAAVKPQLEAACPWSPPAKQMPPSKPRVRVSDSDQDVIGKFNQTANVLEMLIDAGYKPKGKRLLAPTSSSGLAGVTIHEGKCYSHHASDPLNDGFAHDAFDLYVRFHHAGDFSAAVASASASMQWQSVDDLPAIDIAQFMANSAAKARVLAASTTEPALTVPGELTRIPGALQSAVQHSLDCAVKPQKVLSVTGALALGAVVMARLYANETGLRTNLFMVGVGETGCGKDTPRKMIKDTLLAAAKRDRLGGEEFASGAGVLAAVSRQPAAVFQLDEFGQYLQAITNPNAGSHKAEIIRQLMIVRTSAGSMLMGSEYAESGNRKRVDIEYPCAVLHATTTPGEFFQALKSSYVANGMLNRFIVTHSENPSPTRKDPIASTNCPPAALLAWIKEVSNMEGRARANLIGYSPATPVCIGMTQRARELLSAWAIETDKLGEDAAGEGLRALWVRAHQSAIEVAMVVAGSICPAEPKICEVAASWAILFVRYWTQRAQQDVLTMLGADSFAQRLEIVHKFIQRRPGGATVRELAQTCRAYRDARPSERNEVLTALRSSGDIVEHKRIPARGPAVLCYVAREFASTETD